MSMNSFDLHNPTSVKEAIGLLDAQDTMSRRVKIMAGGQDLLTELKERLVEPESVVNLKRIPGLDTLHYDGKDGLRIGALVKVADVEAFQPTRQFYAALAQATNVVGSPQIRHVGTMGGNLCQRPRCWYYRNENIVCLKKGGKMCYAASGENKYNAILGGGPSFIVHPSDTATALVALNASVTIIGPTGTRIVPLEQFFILPSKNVYKENILKSNEIVTAIQVPHPPLAGGRSAYLKFREKMSMDWAMSACAVSLHIDGGKVVDARIVLGGVAPIPWRVPKAEALLKGKAITPDLLHQVADEALHGAVPLAHNGYKVPLTKTLVRRAIQQAAA